MCLWLLSAWKREPGEEVRGTEKFRSLSLSQVQGDWDIAEGSGDARCMSHWVEEQRGQAVASVGLGGITRKVLRTGERASADDPEFLLPYASCFHRADGRHCNSQKRAPIRPGKATVR